MKAFVFGLMLFLVMQTATAQIKVDAMKFGTGVEKNEVVGESASFSSNGTTVYCWAKVVGGESQTVKMRWNLNGAMTDEIPLEIKSWSMRTYSYKQVYQAGNWKVEIVDGNGTVLQSGEFTTQ